MSTTRPWASMVSTKCSIEDPDDDPRIAYSECFPCLIFRLSTPSMATATTLFGRLKGSLM